MHYLFARVVLRELPEAVICSTDRSATVFCRGHYVDVFESGFPNDPFVRNAVQGDAACVPEILAARQLTHMSSEVKHSVFERRLDRARERCVFTLQMGP